MSVAVAMAAEAPSSAAEGRATGFFCSTSGTVFTDKDSLAEHYRSDFHRYNLKRKVAGLPPVTKEWFEARKAQLASAAAAPTQRIWYDPLTRRKFMSEAKYKEHVNSKKYADLVKRSGQPVPAPVIMLKRLDDAAPSTSGATGTADSGGAAAASKPAPGFVVKAPHRPSGAVAASSTGATAGSDGSEDEDDEEDVSEGSEGEGSGWETASASDEDAEEQQLSAATARLNIGTRGRARKPRAAAAAESGSEGGEEEDAGEWEEWDVRRCLFDNHVSGSMEENLEYMYKKYGFYLPDAEYLADPAGLIQYLGSKLQYGKVPLYAPGDDPNPRQFRSLHAVQRHMVDANRCKMAYDDGDEEEYEDYYDYSGLHADGEGGAGERPEAAAEGEAAAAAEGGALVAAGAGLRAEVAAAGLELIVGGGEGGGGAKALGSRWLSRYYKQRPRPASGRPLALAAAPAPAPGQLVAQYRALGIETRNPALSAGAKRAQREQRRGERSRLNLAMKANVLHNLPKNVTY